MTCLLSKQRCNVIPGKTLSSLSLFYSLCIDMSYMKCGSNKNMKPRPMGKADLLGNVWQTLGQYWPLSLFSHTRIVLWGQVKTSELVNLCMRMKPFMQLSASYATFTDAHNQMYTAVHELDTHAQKLTKKAHTPSRQCLSLEYVGEKKNTYPTTLDKTAIPQLHSSALHFVRIATGGISRRLCCSSYYLS